MNQFKFWMRAASPTQQQELAHAAGTTRQYLYHLSADGDRSYAREPSPVLAAAIEAKTSSMHQASGGALPRVYRTDLVTACARCEFARKCLGPVAERRDFTIQDGDTEGGDAS